MRFKGTKSTVRERENVEWLKEGNQWVNKGDPTYHDLYEKALGQIKLETQEWQALVEPIDMKVGVEIASARFKRTFEFPDGWKAGRDVPAIGLTKDMETFELVGMKLGEDRKIIGLRFRGIRGDWKKEVEWIKDDDGWANKDHVFFRHAYRKVLSQVNVENSEWQSLQTPVDMNPSIDISRRRFNQSFEFPDGWTAGKSLKIGLMRNMDIVEVTTVRIEEGQIVAMKFKGRNEKEQEEVEWVKDGNEWVNREDIFFRDTYKNALSQVKLEIEDWQDLSNPIDMEVKVNSIRGTLAYTFEFPDGWMAGKSLSIGLMKDMDTVVKLGGVKIKDGQIVGLKFIGTKGNEKEEAKWIKEDGRWVNKQNIFFRDLYKNALKQANIETTEWQDLQEPIDMKMVMAIEDGKLYQSFEFPDGWKAGKHLSIGLMGNMSSFEWIGMKIESGKIIGMKFRGIRGDLRKEVELVKDGNGGWTNKYDIFYRDTYKKALSQVVREKKEWQLLANPLDMKVGIHAANGQFKDTFEFPDGWKIGTTPPAIGSMAGVDRFELLGLRIETGQIIGLRFRGSSEAKNKEVDWIKGPSGWKKKDDTFFVDAYQSVLTQVEPNIETWQSLAKPVSIKEKVKADGAFYQDFEFPDGWKVDGYLAVGGMAKVDTFELIAVKMKNGQIVSIRFKGTRANEEEQAEWVKDKNGWVNNEQVFFQEIYSNALSQVKGENSGWQSLVKPLDLRERISIPTGEFDLAFEFPDGWKASTSKSRAIGLMQHMSSFDLSGIKIEGGQITGVRFKGKKDDQEQEVEWVKDNSEWVNQGVPFYRDVYNNALRQVKIESEEWQFLKNPLDMKVGIGPSGAFKKSFEFPEGWIFGSDNLRTIGLMSQMDAFELIGIKLQKGQIIGIRFRGKKGNKEEVAEWVKEKNEWVSKGNPFFRDTYSKALGQIKVEVDGWQILKIPLDMKERIYLASVQFGDVFEFPDGWQPGKSRPAIGIMRLPDTFKLIGLRMENGQIIGLRFEGRKGNEIKEAEWIKGNNKWVYKYNLFFEDSYKKALSQVNSDIKGWQALSELIDIKLGIDSIGKFKQSFEFPGGWRAGKPLPTGLMRDMDSFQVTAISIEDGQIIGVRFKGARGSEEKEVDWIKKGNGWVKSSDEDDKQVDDKINDTFFPDSYRTVLSQVNTEKQEWQLLKDPMDMKAGISNSGGTFYRSFQFPDGWKSGKHLPIGLMTDMDTFELIGLEINKEKIVGLRFKGTRGNKQAEVEWVKREDQWVSQGDPFFRDAYKQALSRVKAEIQGWQYLAEPIDMKKRINCSNGTFDQSFEFPGRWKAGKQLGIGSMKGVDRFELVGLEIEKEQIVGLRFKGTSGDEQGEVDWVKRENQWVGQGNPFFRDAYKKALSKVNVNIRGWQLLEKPMGMKEKIDNSRGKFDKSFEFPDGWKSGDSLSIGLMADMDTFELIGLEINNEQIFGLRFRGTKGDKQAEVEWIKRDDRWMRKDDLFFQDAYKKALSKVNVNIRGWQSLEEPIDMKEKIDNFKGLFDKSFEFPDGWKSGKSLSIGFMRDVDTFELVGLEINEKQIVGLRFKGASGDEQTEVEWIKKENQWVGQGDPFFRDTYREALSKVNVNIHGWQSLEEPIGMKERIDNSKGRFYKSFEFPGGWKVSGGDVSIGLMTNMDTFELVGLQIREGQIVASRFKGTKDGKEKDVDWVKKSDGSWEKNISATFEGEVSRLSDELSDTIKDVLGALALDQENQINLAGLLFELFPNRFTSEKYKNINLLDLLEGKFFENLEGRERPVNSPTGFVNDEQIEQLLGRLEVMITDDKAKEKIVDFGKGLELKNWRRNFMKDTSGARDALRIKIQDTKEGVYKLVLQAIANQDQEILALDQLIRDRRLLKEGKSLSYIQLENLVRMLKEKKIILGDEPGMGKTIEILLFALLADEGKAKEIMIATGPLIGKASFERDYDKWFSDETKQSLELVKIDSETDLVTRREILNQMSIPSDKRNGKKRITLWNYHYFTQPSVQDLLKEVKIDVLAFDEAHWLKSEEALRTKAAMQLKAPWMVLSTGTPVDNNSDDLRLLLQMVTDEETEVDPQIKTLIPFLQTERTFKQLFNENNLYRLQYLRQLIKRKMVRQIKEEVMSDDLPVKREQVIRLNLIEGQMIWNGQKIELRTAEEIERKINPFVKQQKLYEAVYHWIKKPENKNYLLGGLGTLRYILSDPESAVNSTEESVLRDFIREQARQLDQDYGSVWISIKERTLEHLRLSLDQQKFLLFSNYLGSIKRYQRLFGNQARSIVGDVKEDERTNIRKQFQENTNEVMEVLGTYDTTGQAADFTRAKVLIVESPANRRSQEKQAIDRTFRRPDQGVHPHLEDGVDVLRLIVDDWETIPSADKHYQKLNEFKEILARLLEDGNFSPKLVETYDQLTNQRNRKFFQGIAPTIQAQIANQMSEAIRLSRQGEYSESEDRWSHLAQVYSENLDATASHSLTVFTLLKLLQLQEMELIHIPKNSQWVFAPSGPGLGMRVIHQLRAEFKQAGVPLFDDTHKQVLNADELDFSPQMQQKAREVLGAWNIETKQHQVNVVQDQWPIDGGSKDVLESSEIWTFADYKPNQKGVNPKVWFLSEANRILKTNGILILSSHHLDFSEAFLKNVGAFGFRVINGNDQVLQLDNKELREGIIGEGYKEQLKKVRAHLKNARVIYLVKEKEVDHTTTHLKNLNGLNLTFEEQIQLEAKGEFQAGIQNGDVDFTNFPWDSLSKDMLKINSEGMYDKTNDLPDNIRAPADELRNILMNWVGKSGQGYRSMWIGDVSAKIEREGQIFTSTKEFKRAQQLVKQVVEGFNAAIPLASKEEKNILELLKASYVNANKVLNADQALVSNTGGIDFNSDKMNLETRNQGGEIKFHLDPAQLAQLQNAPGFTPVIISIQPMTNIKLFLGLTNTDDKTVGV
ncbi:MAG: hypothetical protein HQL15_08215 [Candidatus Omnitrophica bacterium]|nr:hypothetical protein [Candidatus Omnitrophota bacterium]